MSRVICVAGESGSGKTTSMRKLDPASTYYIDCDRKGLSWKGWRESFNTNTKNYVQSSDAAKITALMQKISEAKPETKVVVIDTLNAIMIDDEFNRMREKGYDKWQDLAMSVWQLVSNAHLLRDDLTVVFTAHTQTERDEETGFVFTRIKTNGKKLNKVTLESKFTTVLIAKTVGGRYLFETQAANSTAKTPMGAFSDMEIDNDITAVLSALVDF